MTRESRGGRVVDGYRWERVFCASCGKEGGESIRADGNFAFWVCNDCHARHGAIIGGGVTPHAAFRERVAAETTRADGQPFTVADILDALHNPNSILSKLAREAPGA